METRPAAVRAQELRRSRSRRTLGSSAQIRQNPTRSGARPIDWTLDKERHLVGCVFNWINYFRRISLRCEKTVHSFRSFAALARAMIWLA